MFVLEDFEKSVNLNSFSFIFTYNVAHDFYNTLIYSIVMTF